MYWLMAESGRQAEHEHRWFVSCRRDERGLTVLDCACGARMRTTQGPNGTVAVDQPAPGALGDVIFDLGQVA